jgi:hypothetical protein
LEIDGSNPSICTGGIMKKHKVTIFKDDNKKDIWNANCSGCTYNDQGFTSIGNAKGAARLYHADAGQSIHSFDVKG